LGQATPFIEFMLDALLEACREVAAGDQVSDQVTALLRVLGTGKWSAVGLMRALKLAHRPTFRKNYLHPALAAGWIEMSNPASPCSPVQRYRRTTMG